MSVKRKLSDFLQLETGTGNPNRVAVAGSIAMACLVAGVSSGLASDHCDGHDHDCTTYECYDDSGTPYFHCYFIECHQNDCP